ncbi:MAG: hypothetical protein ACYTHJ_20880 [Planctomycetota bacterium]|jgi:hypothetical protein
MPARPVAQSFVYTTSTGVFGPAYFGTGQVWAGFELSNTSTKSAKGTVQYSLGGSGVWTDVITLTSGSTGDVTLHVGSTAVFDRLRVNITDNEYTSTSTVANRTFWLGAR